MFANAGASTLTVHVEAVVHLHRTLSRIRELGLGAGVAVNPSTPIEAVTEVADICDTLIVMSVNPGFGGQSFIGRSVGKVAAARQLLGRAGSRAAIEVDGGVDRTNAAALAEAGATILVAGQSVYGTPDPARAIQELRRLANAGRP
jgi:ribulose-phosphate 3-epimerase